ncbi:MAG: hemerythrin family protein [Bacteroidales bacterium]|nr:hemerythrin family protein [Bacteroidales bacterium]
MAAEYLKWENEFNTGESKIDEQHQQIFKYINQLHHAIKMDKDEDEVNEILKGLKDYSIYHFNLEEEMMKNKLYPKFESHHGEHVIFIDRLEMLAADMRIKNRSISMRLLKFLKVWFSGHILNTDKKFVQFLLPGTEKPE